MLLCQHDPALVTWGLNCACSTAVRRNLSAKTSGSRCRVHRSAPSISVDTWAGQARRLLLLRVPLQVAVATPASCRRRRRRSGRPAVVWRQENLQRSTGQASQGQPGRAQGLAAVLPGASSTRLEMSSQAARTGRELAKCRANPRERQRTTALTTSPLWCQLAATGIRGKVSVQMNVPMDQNR